MRSLVPLLRWRLVLGAAATAAVTGLVVAALSRTMAVPEPPTMWPGLAICGTALVVAVLGAHGLRRGSAVRRILSAALLLVGVLGLAAAVVQSQLAGLAVAALVAVLVPVGAVVEHVRAGNPRAVARVVATVLSAPVVVGVLLAYGASRPLPGEVPVPAGGPRNTSHYVTMPDGVDLAVDVWLPADLAAGDTVPALMRTTRYTRAAELSWLYRSLHGLGLLPDPNYPSDMATFTGNGYAVVLVDARGSGASFGTRAAEWSPAEVADMGHVIDWITEQPWSSGAVGTVGVSYEGNTAELAAVTGRPALKAVAPLYSDFDPFALLAVPGGVRNTGFLDAWGTNNNALDRGDYCDAQDRTGLSCLLFTALVTGVKPVDGDHDRLRAAQASHSGNFDLVSAVRTGFDFADTPLPGGSLTVAGLSPFAYRDEIEASGVPMFVQVGWWDAFTADGALARYRTLSNPQHVEIGAWSHGGFHDTDPYAPVDAVPDETMPQLIDFFDRHLKDGDPAETSVIRYRTLGGGWAETTAWPPAGVTERTWYLGPDGDLTDEFPPAGSLSAPADLLATSGGTNRWATQSGGGDVVYPDRSAAGSSLLTWTGTPLTGDVTITGNPVVRLSAGASEGTDFALHVYLEDVAPDGRVTYLTEGILRARDRATSEDGPYVVAQPYHPQTRAAATPVRPGTPVTMDLRLAAVSAEVPAGHRLRLAVAAADISTFEKVTRAGDLTVHIGGDAGSAVTLPVAGG